MSDKITTLRSRTPDETREILLEAALEEIQIHGFQSASIERILKHTGLTKGALYHHFKNKKELGYAVVDEKIHSNILAKWVTPLQDVDNPIDTMMQLIISAREQVSLDFKHGCPMVNIGQEMAKLDEGFRQRIDKLYTLWIEAISNALLKGQLEGKVSKKIAPQQVASFFVAAAEGTLVLGKVSQSEDTIKNSAFAIMQFLDSLRV